jgi:hypothetical protein
MKEFLITVMFGLLTSLTHATDTENQRYIEQLTQDSNHSIKPAAQSIYKTGEQDTEVLDVAAEVLLQRYPTASDSDIDTLSWVAKALGNTRNPRYYTTLNEVANSNAHAKLRKYANKARQQVGGHPSGEQYMKGTLNLAALGSLAQPGSRPAAVSNTSTTPATTANAPAAPQNAPAGPSGQAQSSGQSGLHSVRVGMSIQQALDLAGPPTHTATIRGDGRLLFNWKLKDFRRQVLLYRGVGRIEVSDSVLYGENVVEVIIDPNEDGYP